MIFILATTELVEDNDLVRLGDSLGLTVVRGSENDVLSRYALAAECTEAPILVRITGDCPLVDPALLKEMIDEFCTQNIDYLSNCVLPTYPDGLDIEVFTRRALLLAQAECRDTSQREHVTPWIRDSGHFRLGQKRHEIDLSSMRWTVDEPEDLQVIRGVVDHFGGCCDFSWEQVLINATATTACLLPMPDLPGMRGQAWVKVKAGAVPMWGFLGEHASLKTCGDVCTGAVADPLHQSEGLSCLGSRGP